MGRPRVKTSFKHISIANWFPAEDEIAACMARLCVLREDLFIELQGLDDDPLPLLDEGSSDCRQIYFFRNLLRTILEIDGAISKIRSHKEFMAELCSVHPKIQPELDRISNAFGEAHEQVKNSRNEVGGHVLHRAIRQGLPRIAIDTKGLLQIGISPRTIHYKFVLEFIGATMLRHVPLISAKEEWNRIFSRTLDLGLDAINGIDILFASYAQIRKLT